MTAPAAHAGIPRVALAGNPNTGKTSLFNRLTGSNARVGNYPGVTVEREMGTLALPLGNVELMDVPGAYSLSSRSAEEQVAMLAIFGLDGDVRPSLVVVVLDATQLVRNLYLAMQIVEAEIPVVLALNLADVARAQKHMPDPAAVAEVMGVPAVAVSANTGEGLGALRTEIQRVLLDPAVGRGKVSWTYPPALEADIARLVQLVDTGSPGEARALAMWALLSIEEGDDSVDIPPVVRTGVAEIRASGRDVDGEIAGSRYAWLDRVSPGFWQGARVSPARSMSERIDSWLLHPFWGFATFLLVMGVLFQSLFSWSDPAITAIEQAFSWLGVVVRHTLPPGMVADFLVEGVIGGFGSVLVFLPQILLLFFLLGFLEDTGYMARVAYLVDRAMKAVGLHGRAFVPMLSGYACAVPAIMATRTLERRRDRLLTMMVVPLMSCSARLPVYTLVIAALFPPTRWVQGTVMVGMYLFSTFMALVAAAVLGRTVLKGPRVPLLMELPPYRMPRLVSVVRQMWIRAKMFVTEAGGVILVCTIVLWGLLYFPRVPGSSDSPEAAAMQMEHSYGGRIGHAIEPAIAPLGFDWKIGVGLVGAFAAREVFVSTMGVVYGMGDSATEETTLLRDRIRGNYSPLTGISLMVFFALSAQCMSTLAVVRRESRSWGWPIFLFTYMTVLAWVMSLVVYQGGRLLGLG